MSELKLRRLDVHASGFDQELDALLDWESVSDTEVQKTVADVIHRIRTEGDAALLEFSRRFDQFDVSDADQLVLDTADIKAGFDRLPSDQQEALRTAAGRVEEYHGHQIGESWQYTQDDGTVLGQKVTPMDRVGIYVPGGTAPLASSVIMNAMPARVAGVQEVVMATPAPKGQVNDFVLGAAHVAGIDRIFLMGGAQAVAALAFGTETVPSVDKIVGPGNIFVATAKKLVFGKVGIDMIAGPSEILVVCDGKTDPDWIALDLFSQAEHDTDAQSILISQDGVFLDAVSESIARLLPEMERADVIRQSLADRGALIQVDHLEDAQALINRIAPEHLELSIEDPESWLPHIRHAGAIFLGRHTPEALGDYCAGPNHVLPTSGTARFFSPLGVYDFQKRSSLIGVSPEGARTLGAVASVLARGEQLTAHARSAEKRIDE